MRIRKKQMEALEKIALAAFIDEAVKFLPEVEPARAATLGDQAQLRKWTVEHVDLAFVRGLTAEISILRFLEIALVHGRDFAEDGGTLSMLVNEDCLEDWPTSRGVLDAIATSPEAPPAPAEASIAS